MSRVRAPQALFLIIITLRMSSASAARTLSQSPDASRSAAPSGMVRGKSGSEVEVRPV